MFKEIGLVILETATGQRYIVTSEATDQSSKSMLL